jgi:hypothetical protein
MPADRVIDIKLMLMYSLANVLGKAQGRTAQSVAHCPPIAELGIGHAHVLQFWKKKIQDIRRPLRATSAATG